MGNGVWRNAVIYRNWGKKVGKSPSNIVQAGYTSVGFMLAYPKKDESSLSELSKGKRVPWKPATNGCYQGIAIPP